MYHSDVEECSDGTHSCSQLCVELDGGYECDCSDGYELGDNKVTCKGTCSNITSSANITYT